MSSFTLRGCCCDRSDAGMCASVRGAWNQRRLSHSSSVFAKVCFPPAHYFFGRMSENLSRIGKRLTPGGELVLLQQISENIEQSQNLLVTASQPELFADQRRSHTALELGSMAAGAGFLVGLGAVCGLRSGVTNHPKRLGLKPTQMRKRMRM